MKFNERENCFAAIILIVKTVREIRVQNSGRRDLYFESSLNIIMNYQRKTI